MDILNESEVFKNLQNIFKQDRYWTVLNDCIIDYDIINFSKQFKEKSVYDVFLVEVEKEIIHFNYDSKNGFYPVIRFPDEALRMIYICKNNFFSYPNIILFNLFENRDEAEKYLKKLLLDKMAKIEKQLNEIKLQLIEKRSKVTKRTAENE